MTAGSRIPQARLQLGNTRYLWGAMRSSSLKTPQRLRLPPWRSAKHVRAITSSVSGALWNPRTAPFHIQSDLTTNYARQTFGYPCQGARLARMSHQSAGLRPHSSLRVRRAVRCHPTV